MPLEHLQHILIQTADLEGTKDWWVDVLGLEVGPHPDFRVPVYRLYLNGRDVLHITAGGPDVSENSKRYAGRGTRSHLRQRHGRPVSHSMPRGWPG